MSNTTTQPPVTAMIPTLVELAGEIDGVADFGMTVCMSDQVAARARYIAQRCDKIRILVDDLALEMQDKQFAKLQSDLIGGVALLTNSFQALGGFRELSQARIRSTTEALRAGWEQVHRVIRGIAETLAPGDQSWYRPILERQVTYRTQLEQVSACFEEVALSHSLNGGSVDSR